MHSATGDQPLQPSPRLWLFGGSGDGPPLAQLLLERGWRLRVSLLSPSAARPYPRDPQLELQIGALGGAAALAQQLRQAATAGEPFRLVLDTTHPFATQVQRDLAEGCQRAGRPLLRLQRPRLSGPAGLQLQPLDNLEALREAGLAPGERLLFAIGARQLPRALAASPQALHHARLLPNPLALQQALAAGLAPERLACLQPAQADGALEAALLERWRITAVVARESGPPTESLWRRLTARHGCRLLLLRRPAPAPGAILLGPEALQQALEHWRQKPAETITA
jgi:precorrin-6A/cobalt-precorrin-6A reductase